MIKIKSKSLVYSILALFLIANVFLWSAGFKKEDKKLKVYFFNIGQGDAIYIRTMEGQDILIDGGPDKNILAKLGQFMPINDRKIELVFLTHPHADHLDGLIEVLKNYQVDRVLETGARTENKDYKLWETILQEKKIIKDDIIINDEINLGLEKISVMWPNNEGIKAKDVNQASEVLKLSYRENNFIFMGDAGIEVEKKIKLDNMNAVVLKIGHHGSKYASSRDFLEAINPKYAIISAGQDNRYKHPHQETLNLLEALKIKYWRTDLDGDIKCEDDGKILFCDKLGN